ncbi:MAG: ArsR family transcriptional regulator, partial [Rhabdochlamydiaceae bacterium]
MENNDDPEFVLKGKTLDIYLYLLRHKDSAGISEIQKALGFSSPSIASHHLEKLVKLGVASKDAELGKFALVRKVDIRVLQGFVNVGTLILPRFAFYASLFLVIA